MRTLFILFFLIACASKVSILDRGPLLQLLLRPYPGYRGKLVNQRCTKYEGKKCVATDAYTVDLENAVERKKLRDLYFVCDVGGQRFGICTDRPGLCQQTYKEKKFLFITYARELVVLKYIAAVEDYMTLLESDTVCASLNSTFGREMFEVR